MNPRLVRNSLFYLITIVAVLTVFFTLFGKSMGTETVPISTVVQWAKEESISSIEVQGGDLTVTTHSDETFRSRQEDGASIVETLERAGINTGDSGLEINVKGRSGFGSFFTLLINFLPLIIFGGLLLFMMRQAQGSGSQAMNFGRSKARLVTANRPTVSFADVAGVEESKLELQEVVEFLKNPERFTALGARIVRGVLLVGPPGTGKTLIARAVAGEAAVPFYSISGSEFVEMFVGVGASRVRDLFDQAKRNSPCIVFVDEIDAVGRHRGAGLGGGHDEREQTLNQILVEMDGFDNNTNVIVLAATNRPDILDPALLRPGRFDRRVVMDSPDVAGRVAILEVHARGKPIEDKVSLDLIARQTPGFSGADLANLLNEAAILAARGNKRTIGIDEFNEAVDRVLAGPERKSRIISQRDKEITAFHEAGHTLVARRLPNADPVHKVTIVSRGAMGGYTRLLPQEDRQLWTKSQFADRLSVAMGGRVAEELVFGITEVTTGASNDLEQATQIARQMVTRYAMSDRPTVEFDEIPISTVFEWVRSGKSSTIDVYGDDLLITTKAGKVYRSKKEPGSTLIEAFQGAGIRVDQSKVSIQVKSPVGLMGLGPRTFGRREEMVFLGREISEQRDYSNEMATMIDEDVKILLADAYQTARGILAKERPKLDQIARYLIRYESAEGEELGQLLDGDVPVSEPESDPEAIIKTNTPVSPEPKAASINEGIAKGVKSKSASPRLKPESGSNPTPIPDRPIPSTRKRKGSTLWNLGSTFCI